MSKLIFKTVVGEQHPTTTYTKALDEMITKYSELEQVFRISHTDNNSSEITKKFANKSINFIIGTQNIDSNTNYFTLDFNKKVRFDPAELQSTNCCEGLPSKKRQHEDRQFEKLIFLTIGSSQILSR